MSHVLFLTYRMSRGFGVDLVISQLTQELQEQNIPVSIGCLVSDGSYRHHKPIIVPPDPAAIGRLATALNCDVLIAHSSPFFEMLPVLRKDFKVYAWEHGDPDPALRSDKLASQNQKNYKQQHVYPNVDGVIAISKFIRRDIHWPAAKVIYNGCDHIPDPGSKTLRDLAAGKKLKIGGLMRFGAGESEYKGSAVLVELFNKVRQKYPVELHIMGKGKENDVRSFRDNGFVVHLNATNQERDSYLRSLDIFVSTSLWEGFNLPLAEAQASGTVALALGRGAHPEVTPLVFSSIGEASRIIGSYIKNRKKLYMDSLKARRFVRSKFSWKKSTGMAILFLGLKPESVKSLPVPGSMLLLRLRLGAVGYFLKKLGIRLFLRKVFQRIALKLH